MRRKDGPILPGYMRMPLALALAVNFVTYFGSRLLTKRRVHYDLSGAWDRRIPFVPWTVVIYLGCYFFWAGNYVMGCRQEEETAYRFISADLLAKLVCLGCFLALPTTNTRPVIEGHSVFEEAMRMLYRMDAADNLFPSIHCLTSWFCYIAVRSSGRVPGWYKTASLLTAVSICVSTLTTKQHVLIDVFAGVLLAEGSYFFVKKSGFAGKYAALMKKIQRWEEDPCI